MALSKIPSAGFQDNVKFRNILINGSLDISQRSTSTSSITSTGYHTVDRWQTNISSMGTWTQSQSTTVPSGQGFAKSLKMDCTTADASPSAGDQVVIEQKVEGQNLQYLNFGNSSAKSLTLSFWVRSNKTGTYCASLFNNDQSKWFSKQYTISSADTWEKKTLTYAGDTSNAFNNDNGTSLRCRFWLGAGSTYTSGTITSTWTTESGNEGSLASGQVNLADSTSNEWYITGVQLEAGTTASDFEFLPVDVNLQRCKRYYQKIGEVPYTGITTGYQHSTVVAAGGFPLGVKMRSAPSLSATNLIWTDRVNFDSDATLDGSVSSASSIYLRATFSTSGAAYRGGVFAVKNVATGFLELNSEL